MAELRVTRACAVCGEEFAARQQNQRFCPPDTGKSKSSCARAYGNAKRRGTLDALLARGARPGAEFDCERCGVHCVPGDTVAAHARRFCSRECKRAWHSRHSEGHEPKRQRLARLHLEAAARGSSTGRLWIAGPCAECGCGVSFVGVHGDARYCSERCHVRHKGRRHRHRPGQRARRNAAKRERRTVTGGPKGEFPVASVGDRDDWVCGICGNQVDESLDNRDPMGPTVDHIVPISRGGEHSLTNVQLAHRACNSRKGDALTA